MATRRLHQVLGRGFSTAVCIGGIIGLGILRTPGEIAATVSSPALYMGFWVVGGAFTLLSLFVVAELMSMTPRSGGIYAMISRTYGAFPSFVVGWVDWLAVCSTMALKAVVAAEYLALLMPPLQPYLMPLAVAITSAFAGVQLLGTKVSGGIQEAASAGIGLIILALTVALFYGAAINGGPIEAGTTAVPVARSDLAAYGLVLAAIVFTYDGWVLASYFGEEIKSGGRAVAVGSIYGFIIVIALYLLLNLALISSVSMALLAGNDLVLARAIELVFGGTVGIVVVVAAVLILLAHQNLQYMVAARVLYALSVDGMGSQRATTVTDNGAPAGAVLLSWIVVVAMIVFGYFEFLLNLTVTFFTVLYVALLLGVFRLRRTEPGTDRPFMAWCFPATGYICVGGWSVITLYVAATSIDSTIFAAVLVLLGLPAYRWLSRSRQLDEARSAG